VCRISYNNNEFFIKKFEVLINTGDFAWQSLSDSDDIPMNAVAGGYTSKGVTLYVGRAMHAGLIIPGKVHGLQKCLYLPCDHQEHRKNIYEILVRKSVDNVDTLPREAS
jgi:Protein of unknown function (DUF3421)